MEETKDKWNVPRNYSLCQYIYMKKFNLWQPEDILFSSHTLIFD